MTISNHLLVGAAIATVVKQPLLALPLAFASHFVLDALPHFGYNNGGYKALLKHRMTFVMLLLDIVGVTLIALTFGLSQAMVWAGAILALSPDLEWPYRYLLFERKGKTPPETALTRFHERVQWCERPWGFWIEIVFFIVVLTLVSVK
jgi:hypothetical protein